MKKLLSAILLVALVLSLTACGGSPQAEPKQEVLNSGTVESTNGNDKNNNSQLTSEKEPSSKDSPSTIEETVVYDKNNLKVTAVGLDESSFMGPEIKMLFENNSNKNVTIQSEYCTINGYMVNTMMSVDLAAGKKANSSLTLMKQSLTDAGIEKITDIKFNLITIDSATFNRINVSDMISLKTSNEGKYTQEYDDKGTVIYDENNIKVVSKGINKENIFGQALRLYIENNTDKPVVIQCDNASVNGFMISSMFSTTVIPKTRAIDDITFLSSSLEENNIVDIKDVELSLIIIDEKSFKRIAVSKPISIKF